LGRVDLSLDEGGSFVRKFALAAASVLTLATAAAPAAMAANPPGTGEPGTAFNVESCPTTGTLSPNGFNMGGFANTATAVYAAQPANRPKNAVSEYDIACFQTTQPH
jgi:hypothetical protein